MPSRKKTKLKSLGQDKTGRYFRNIGWILSERTGKYFQKKFYLGHDHEPAQYANLRLESLWKCVESVHQRERIYDSMFSSNIVSQSGRLVPVGNVLRLDSTRDGLVDRPIWTPLTLDIAESIRNGAPIARISDKNLPEFNSNVKLDQWLSKIREDYNMIHVELSNESLSNQLNERIRETGLKLKAKGQQLLALPKSSQKFHHAIEVYITEVQKEKVNEDGTTSEWAKAKSRQINFLKHHTEDFDLGIFSAASIDIVLNTLRRRPLTKSGAHCSKRYAANCIKEFRVFLEWLDECEIYDWNWPQGYTFSRGLITDNLSNNQTSGPIRLVKHNTVDELKLLYEFATPIQRLILLLGLNCGFVNSEQGSLQANEIYLRPQTHPDADAIGLDRDLARAWIVRLRKKTQVYGTWNLWPQTIQALEWWLGERKRIEKTFWSKHRRLSKEGIENLFTESTKGRLLITTNSKPMVDEKRTGAIPNRWNSLRRSIAECVPSFNSLSVKYLRKTGSTLIRRVSNAEVASVYLAHGKPYGHDNDLDIYAARPYGKLVDALDEVHELLSPLWESVTNPFSESRKFGGKEKLTPAQKRSIENAIQLGEKPREIASKLEIHPSTVYRLIKRAK